MRRTTGRVRMSSAPSGHVRAPWSFLLVHQEGGDAGANFALVTPCRDPRRSQRTTMELGSRAASISVSARRIGQPQCGVAIVTLMQQGQGNHRLVYQSLSIGAG